MSAALLSTQSLTKIVPVMVAVMVWIIRILIIGTFSMAGDRLFWMDEKRNTYRPQVQTQSARPVLTTSR